MYVNKSVESSNKNYISKMCLKIQHQDTWILAAERQTLKICVLTVKKLCLEICRACATWLLTPILGKRILKIYIVFLIMTDTNLKIASHKVVWFLWSLWFLFHTFQNTFLCQFKLIAVNVHKIIHSNSMPASQLFTIKEQGNLNPLHFV